MSKKLLIVVDMQNDFITGPLGSKAAENIVDSVVKKIGQYHDSNNEVFLTKDTHGSNYKHTLEGKKLPIKHCIKNTSGWELCDEILKNSSPSTTILKDGFGSVFLMEIIERLIKMHNIESIEFVGVCTDICVISNVLLAKSYFPNISIIVDASCCSGTTIEAHNAALKVMKSCQIDIINEDK